MHERTGIQTRVALVSVVGAMLMEVSGCAPTHPLVVNSTEPWEDELARERQAAHELESSTPPTAVARQMDDTDRDEEKKPEHTAFVVALTDIIGFPFRGAGWLAREIF